MGKPCKTWAQVQHFMEKTPETQKIKAKIVKMVVQQAMKLLQHCKENIQLSKEATHRMKEDIGKLCD